MTVSTWAFERVDLRVIQIVVLRRNCCCKARCEVTKLLAGVQLDDFVAVEGLLLDLEVVVGLYLPGASCEA